MTTIDPSAGYADSDLAPLLAQLTELSSVTGSVLLHSEGTQADSLHTSEDRAIWIPARWRARPVKLQPDDGHAIAEFHEGFAVSLYASSKGALKVRYGQLIAALENILSWTGFEAVESTPAVRGGGQEQSGWGILVPVVLKGPIYDLAFKPGLITSTTGNVSATFPSGSTLTQLPTGGAP